MGRHPIGNVWGSFALVVLLLSSAPSPARADEPLRLAAGHAYDLAVAKSRIGYLLDYWQSRFGVKASWAAARVQVTGAVHGIAIDGWIEIRGDAVIAEVNDPGFFWRSTARSYVGRMLRKYLHPRYAEN
jgi:hypothetical protein